MERARAVALAAGLALILALFALVLPRGLVSPAAAAITPTDDGLTLATAIAGPGAVVKPSSHLTQSALIDPPGPLELPNAVSSSQLTAFPTDGAHHTIMTTGDASAAGKENTNPSEAPSEPIEGDDQSLDLQRGNLRGDTDFDVSVLRVDLEVAPEANCLSLDFQFLSEEFPDWIDGVFNDAFIAELDESTWTTAGSVITAPDNFAFAPDGQDEGEEPDVVSVNAIGLGGFSAADAEGTTYDGATPLLSAATQVTPGAHSVFFSIFDQGDRILDSAVFLDNLRVGYVDDPGEQCVPGAQVKAYALALTPTTETLPVGEAHTVTATLLDLNEDAEPVEGVELLFGVEGPNPAEPGLGPDPTDDDGTTTFSFDGDSPGTDTVFVCYDADGSATCDGDEPFASATAVWQPVVKPRVAFTDDRDETWTVEIDRDLDDHDDDPDTGYLETFAGGNRDRAGIRRARHTGEASPVGSGSATYVSTIQDRHGEVYLSHDDEGGLSFGDTSTRQRITCANDALESHPVYSDGWVAWASDIDGDWDIYVAYELDGGPMIPEAERVGGACGDWKAFLVTEDPVPAPDEDDAPPPPDDLWPAWTPDGEALVYSSTRDDPLGDIYRIWVDDGPVGEPVRQTDHPGADTQPSVGDYQDEEWIAFTTTRFRPDGSIGMLRSATQEVEDVPNVTPAWPGGRQGSEPAWGGEPDDPNIAFTSTENDAYGDVWVADLADAQGENAPQFRTGGVNPVADRPGVAESHPTWRDEFFDTADDVEVELFRPAPGWALRRPLPAAAPPDEDGELLITVRAMDADVTDVLAVDGSQRRRIVHEGFGEGGTYDEAGPDYSPDGKRIAFSRDVVTGGEGREIMLADADGTNPESLAELTDRGPGDDELPGDVDSDPVWSPDGTRIAFVRQRGVEGLGNGPPTVWVVSLTGGPLFEIPTSHGDESYVDTNPSWSPDGDFLAIARQTVPPPAGLLGNARRGGPGPQLGTEHEVWVVRAAPESDDAVQLAHIYTDPFASEGPDQEPLKELVRGRSPAWSPDGTQIAYDDRGSLRLVDLDPAGPSAADFDDREWEIENPQAVTGFRDTTTAPFDQTGDPTDSRPRISVAEDPAWSDDGTEIAFAGQPAGQPDQRGIYAIAPDGSLESLRMLTDLHPQDQDADQPRDQDARGPETEPTWQPPAEADVSVTVTITGSPAAASLPFTATYVVTNNGPSTAQGVTLTTAVPPGGSRLAVAPPAGCLADGGGCSFPSLGSGLSRTYEVRLSYPAAVEGTATGTVTSLTADPLPGNNTDSADFTVAPALADLAVTIVLDEPIGYVGGRRTATVTVRNNGPGPAEGVTLRTAYPTFVAPAATETCLVDGTACALGDLPPATELEFTIDLVAVEAGIGFLLARVATTSPDSVPANNRAVSRLEVKQPSIRLLPSVARPGQVVLAYGEDMPPGSRVTVDWEPGITVDTGPFRVRADGTMRASLLLVRRDRLGDRTLTATSLTSEFTPVTGEMLVVLRLMTPPDLVGRG